jgi:hypothetical protein
MTSNKDLEIKIITTFVDKRKQDRYIGFVSNSKTRQKFIRDLAHFKLFKENLFDKINNNVEELIFSSLKKNKINDKHCYVISENSKIDSRNLDIRQALQQTIGYGMGTILVFGDGELIFHESEEMNNRQLSKFIK